MLEFPQRARVLCGPPRQKPNHQNGCQQWGGAGGSGKRREGKEKEGKKKGTENVSCWEFRFTPKHAISKSKEARLIPGPAGLRPQAEEADPQDWFESLEEMRLHVESISESNSEQHEWRGVVRICWPHCRKSPCPCTCISRYQAKRSWAQSPSRLEKNERGSWFPAVGLAPLALWLLADHLASLILGLQVRNKPLQGSCLMYSFSLY